MPAARSVAKNFSGSPMPAKARTGRPDSAAIGGVVGLQARREKRAGRAAALSLSTASALGAVADHQQRVDALELRIERRAQRPGRKHHAVADAAPRHRPRAIVEIFCQRRILQAVVHHDDVGACASRGLRAGDAVARHDRRRGLREQQRLVADVGGACAAADRPAAGPLTLPP